MNYSAAARRGRARRGGRPGPRVPRRCEAAAATSQTFPGRHRGCGPRGASVPARARRPRFPRCRLFYVFCLGVGTCPRERVSLPTPSPPDRGGGGGTGDPERRRRGGGGGGSKAPTGPAARRDLPGTAAVPAGPGASVPRGGQGFGCARNTNEASGSPRPCPLRARTGRGPSLTPTPTPRSAAHPPPGAGARGRGGRLEQRIRRPNPAPRPAGPRARPRGHATPGAPRRAPPARGPARLPARPGGTAPRGPHRPPASRPGAARLRGRAGASPGPCSPSRPGTEAVAGARSAAAFRGAGCHDCGQEGRARRLWPGSGTRGGPTVSGLRTDRCAPRTAARVAGSALQGPACAPELWTKSRARARGRRRRRASPRAGNNFLLRWPRAEELRGVLGLSLAPGGDYTATPRDRAAPFRAPSRGGRDRPGSRVPPLVIMPRRPQRLFSCRLSGFPAESPAWPSGAWGRHRVTILRPPLPVRA
ncbi:collagen alpha-1(II) chain-like [Lutra lutra]|uniref:collagen alpha-1(II) chain-like n=1 Tax=Lutra lutra TaxID=9657 RepID=UPI001FD2070B|nr:collagen alpha-1(II) chain-like [Lutra lutra]